MILTLTSWYWGKGVCVRMIGDRIRGMQSFELQGKDPERIQLKLQPLRLDEILQVHLAISLITQDRKQHSEAK